MSAIQMMAAFMLTGARICAIVLIARVATFPGRYTWPQALLILILGALAFLPVSFL